MEKNNKRDRVAVVILNWNGRKMLEKFLAGVVAHTEPLGTVYVADNASTDDSIEYLRKEFPQVPLLILDKNYGFAEGYNRALEQINASYYLLLNSDVEVTPGWLDPLVRYMDSHPEVAACQPKLLSYFQKDSFEYAGAAGGYLDYLGYPFCRGRVLDTVERDKGQYDQITQIFWATGAALMIRSEDYWQAGGLDGDFFAHMEEIDLCWRLNTMGRKLVCIPDSVAYHWGGGTLPKENPRKTFLNFRNNLLMLYKNLPDQQLQKILFFRMLLDGVAAMQFLLKGQWGNFKAVIQAHNAYRAFKPKYRTKRLDTQSKAVSSSVSCIFPKSMVFLYLFRGQKNYSQLAGKNHFMD
ncbi:MAG: glycosyltransferase family 2 protein [Candidatus Paraprevotella stercoravium]|uniref:Glycosyltransferase family 2 protein n=1 Tax=Candidatus Paraprevotella stercoravium TaxID=2838725 RepID=A0A9E2L438_9BACT|nr:glycosyltransferase family 2 protein [Candidatus Paraprevotella stercoravium]